MPSLNLAQTSDDYSDAATLEWGYAVKSVSTLILNAAVYLQFKLLDPSKDYKAQNAEWNVNDESFMVMGVWSWDDIKDFRGWIPYGVRARSAASGTPATVTFITA